MAASQIYPLELIDETLDINATDNYDLTLELSEEGVSLAVLDLLRGKYVMLRHYPREKPSDGTLRPYTGILDSDDFLRRRYRKMFIITPTANGTMIPSPVFEPGLQQEYYKFNCGESSGNRVYSNTLPFPDAVVLFAPADEITDSITSRWHDIVPWHQTRPLLTHASAASRNSEEYYIQVHFEKDFVTVVIIRNRDLTFCNSFAISAPHDGAYFLFSVLDRLGIRHDETIYASGMIEPYGEAHIALLNFSSGVRFAAPQIRYGFSYVMNELHLHRWLNLFTAASCE
jgi:hypothetical protein